jgi:hypothetical protein
LFQQQLSYAFSQRSLEGQKMEPYLRRVLKPKLSIIPHNSGKVNCIFESSVICILRNIQHKELFNTVMCITLSEKNKSCITCNYAHEMYHHDWFSSCEFLLSGNDINKWNAINQLKWDIIIISTYMMHFWYINYKQAHSWSQLNHIRAT